MNTKFINVNGLKIPIFASTDIVSPIAIRLGSGHGSKDIQIKIEEELSEIIDNTDTSVFKKYFDGNVLFDVNLLEIAYLSHQNSDSLRKWISLKSRLIGSVIIKTREFDSYIQYLINYEDIIYLMKELDEGKKTLIDIYETRGIEFFATFFYGKAYTNIFESGLLKENCKSIVDLLLDLGRPQEAEEAQSKIEDIEKRIHEIDRTFPELNYDPSSDPMRKIKIAGQKFWSTYLAPNVWTILSKESQEELVDAFSNEFFLRRNIFSTWSNAILSLCKCIERELAISIFYPYIHEISVLIWDTTSEKSVFTRKKVVVRNKSFDIFVSAAKAGHAPTLGQMMYGLKFFNDEIMDTYCSLNKIIGIENNDFYIKIFNELYNDLINPIRFEGGAISVLDARNQSAHPRIDSNVRWDVFLDELKKALGQSPQLILSKILSVRK